MRMIRRLLVIASVLSLLPGLAILATGIYSFRLLMALRWWNDAAANGVVVTRGSVLFWRQLQLDNQGASGPHHFEHVSFSPSPKMKDYESPGMTPHLGFGFGMGDDRTRYPVRQLLLPTWAIALTALLVPLWPITAWRRRVKRLQSNQCLVCGYDLRASPTRCPECGTTVPTAAGAERV